MKSFLDSRTVVDIKMQSFRTIEREQEGKNPSRKGTTVPKLHELILPHLESFNAIKATNDGRGPGLLDLSIADLEPREITDTFGNSLKCKKFMIYGCFRSTYFCL